jgi:hypothetical protein
MSTGFSRYFRPLVLVMLTSGAGTVSTVLAGTSENIILVPPTDLPEPARQTGDTLLLHETLDGRTLLYIEQNEGARLAVLEVSDPAHVKSKGTVPLEVPGPFDFVSALGDRAELVRFRQGQGDAVLDLRKVSVPTLRRVPGSTLPGSITTLGNDGFIVSSQAANAPLANDYQVVNSGDSMKPVRVYNIKNVRKEIEDRATGATYLLTDQGLYLVRRPAIEADKRNREQESGG